jgi:hypothetical protein
MHIVIVASAKAVAAGQIYETVTPALENLVESYSYYDGEHRPGDGRGFALLEEGYLG